MFYPYLGGNQYILLLLLLLVVCVYYQVFTNICADYFAKRMDINLQTAMLMANKMLFFSQQIFMF